MILESLSLSLYIYIYIYDTTTAFEGKGPLLEISECGVLFYWHYSHVYTNSE